MKKLLLIALLSFAGLSLQAQTLYINNHTACPVNVYPFAGSGCPATCGMPGGTPYVAGAFSSGTLTVSGIRCSGSWQCAVLNTNPNPNGWPDGCQLGDYVYDGNTGLCNPIYSGSFYVVSCGVFVNVTWQTNVPSPGDVTIDIN